MGVITKSQEFTADGTFTVPAEVTLVWVTMVGAGGGGTAINCSGGGGGGEYIHKIPVCVTPAEQIAVTVGVGGVADRAPAYGGNTTFAAATGTITASGGISCGGAAGGAGGGTGGGVGGTAAAGSPGVTHLISSAGSGGGAGTKTGVEGYSGGANMDFPGGAAGATLTSGGGGGGGSSALGRGGGGGGIINGSPGGNGTGYGSGGGGSIGGASGGNGANGYAKVEWIAPA